MRRLRFAFAAAALLVAFPLMLLAFRHRERLDAISAEAEAAERRGQFRNAALIWESGARAAGPLADPLLAALNLFRISAPTRAGMLLSACRAHLLAAEDALDRMIENPTLTSDARRALERLVGEFGASALAEDLAGRAGRVEALAAAQTLHLAGRHAEAVARLAALRVPEDEACAHHRFLRARLLGIARLALYREGRDPADLARAMRAFAYCFPLGPDDPFLAHHHAEAERLLLERIAERIPYREGVRGGRSE